MVVGVLLLLFCICSEWGNDVSLEESGSRVGTFTASTPRWLILTLMLVVANLANTKMMQKTWNPVKWVLIWEYLARAFKWVPTRQGLDGFQKNLLPCALDESSLSIGRVNPFPMLRLLSSKAQGRKEFWKTSKPCHNGIYWIALAEYSQMSTCLPEFQSFFRFFCNISYRSAYSHEA